MLGRDLYLLYFVIPFSVQESAPISGPRSQVKNSGGQEHPFLAEFTIIGKVQELQML